MTPTLERHAGMESEGAISNRRDTLGMTPMELKQRAEGSLLLSARR